MKQTADTSEQDSSLNYPVTVTDMTGRTVTINEEPQRIVSGYYISTSILMALGLENKLAGIEAKADKRPIYKLAAPELIDLPNVGSLKNFDLEACAALEPDLIILPKKLKDSVPVLEELGLTVVLIDPEDTDRLIESISLIGKCTNKTAAADDVIKDICTVRSDLSSKLSGKSQPRIIITGNSSPLSVAASNMFQSDLISMAGGTNCANELNENSWTEIDYEQLLLWDPEYIIIASEADYSVDDILNNSDFQNTSAVKNKNVYKFPSSAESLDSPVPAGFFGGMWLASILHPEDVTHEDFFNSIKNFYDKYYGFEYKE